MRVITPKDRACFDDMLAPEKVGTIRDALPSFFANLQERGDLHISMGHLQTTHRYVLTILWLAPFADSEIYEYPVILKFLYRLWKSNSYTPVCYHSNTLCHGSVFQHWCRATNIGKDVSHGGIKTAPWASNTPSVRHLLAKRQLRSPTRGSLSGPPRMRRIL